MWSWLNFNIVWVGVIAIYAVGMSLFWANARAANPTVHVSYADPGAFIAIGLLGSAVARALLSQDRRIRRLEEQLRNRSEGS